MKSYYLTTLFILTTIFGIQAQESLSGTLIDSTSQKPIPYATITLNDSYGVISNETGKFQIYLKEGIALKDSLFFSCLGYETKHIAIENFTDSIIILTPKIIELNEVLVTNKNYSVDEIIEMVKKNLKSNYDFGHTKSKLFYRESYYNHILKREIKIKKSTIPEFNQEFIDSLMNSIPLKSDNYTEILGNLYGKIHDEDDDSPQKLDIIKASQLYDKNNEITFTSFEEKINEVIRKRVKKDSYFKIKSGIFSTKEEMDSTIFNNSEAEDTAEFIEAQKKKEIANKKNFFAHRRHTISGLVKNSFIHEDSDLDFLEKSSKYKFELLDYAFLNDNFVYKITFVPKRGATYKGILYINLQDLAIERVDYENIKPLKKFSLLGLSFNMYLHKGTLVYSKNDSGKYALKFAEMEDGNRMGVDRPLKIIEKNKHVKGRRKQNELSSNVHFIVSSVTKKELIVFENNHITESEYTNFKENATVKPIYLPKYDPDFWKGYNVLEPNQAIKDFKSLD